MQLADAQPVPNGPSGNVDASVAAVTEPLTFLIADVRGYTRFTVEHGDEAAAELAMKFAALAREAVAGREGEVLELRGDEVLAVFTSTDAALRAALELQIRLQRETEAEPTLPLRAGVGVAVGNAVPVEGGFRGIPLNLAARLCSLAGPGEVLASAGAVELAGVGNGLSYVERGPVELKGFVDPIPVTQVIGEPDAGDGPGEERTAALTPRLPIGVSIGSLPSGAIVAREEEVAAIQSAIDAVTEGVGRMIVLTGRRGIGKTRLAQEATLLAHQQGFLIAAGRCYADRQGSYLSPLAQALAAAFSAAPASIRFGVRRRWPALLPLLSEQLAAASGQGRGGLNIDQVIPSATGFLSSLAGERPVALLLDDLHWADDASLRLLAHLARQLQRKRVFILVAYREAEPGPNPALEQTLRDLSRERLVERISLHRLPPEGTAAMVAATVGDMEATEEFQEFVHRRTKGVPLYVEQVVRSLGGRYRLVRQIGAGGMGRVFQAVDTETGEQVAAKIMFASREAAADAERRFQQEGAVLAELQHLNIVKVHGTFLEEHASCIIMELLEGRSLGEVLRHPEGTRSLDLARTREIAEQVASALAYAHRRGIVHRDVKPDNIMLVGQDQVKVTDFGIARVIRPEATLSTMTSTGVALGTPLYMAPEQIEGHKVDGRADVYALGAVLYQMVTGRPPFEGDDPLTIAFKHVGEAPVPPTEVSPDLPPDWGALILKALAKDPAQRFASAGAMQRAIAELSVPDATVQEAPTRRRRWRRPASVVSGASLLLAGAVVYFGIAVGGHTTAHAAIGPPVPGWGVQQAVGTISYPYGLAADPAGNIYVTDQLNNRVVKMSTQGEPLAAWGSAGTGLGQFSQAGQPAVDAAGNTYVADTQANRVEEFGPDGTPLASLGSSGAGTGQLNSPQAVAVDDRGHVYVADLGNNRVEEFFTSGKAARTFATFPAIPSQPPGPSGVAVDSAGNVYASVSQKNDIEVFAPNGKRRQTISGPATGIRVFTALDTKVVRTISGREPALGRLASPSLVAVGPKGDVYVLDSNNTRLQEFSPHGRLLRHWSLVSSNAPGAFINVTGLAVDASGAVYLADVSSHQIQRVLPSGRFFASWGSQTGHPIQLNQPNGVAVDGRGNVYVADNGDNSIWQLSPTGRFITIWGNTSGPARFSDPDGVAADVRGDLYVADTGNNRIAAFSAARRTWSTLRVPSLSLSAPYGVAVDRHDDIYIADTGNNAVEVVSAAGKLLHRWGTSDGSQGTAPGGFNNPYAVAVDGQGDLYVADKLNQRVQELPATGSRWTVLSTGSLQLSAPTGIAVDPFGNVDVVDSDSNRVVELSSSGKLLGTVGVTGSGPGQLDTPTAIAFDRQGNAYVTDTGNDRLQKFAVRN